MSIGVKRSIKVITAFIELRIVYELEDEKLYVHIVSVFIKGEIVIFHVFRNKVNQSIFITNICLIQRYNLSLERKSNNLCHECS